MDLGKHENNMILAFPFYMSHTLPIFRCAPAGLTFLRPTSYEAFLMRAFLVVAQLKKNL